jgi:GAF domain-containing protein
MSQFSLIEDLRRRILRESLRPGTSQANVATIFVEGAARLVGFLAISVYLIDRHGRLDPVAIATQHPQLEPNRFSLADKPPARSAFQGWRAEDPYAAEYVNPTGGCAEPEALAHYYGQTFGPLSSFVRIPLNGSIHTLGIIDAIDWQSSFVDPEGVSLTWTDSLERLRLLAMVCSSALTVWRGRQETVMIARLTESLKDVDFEDSLADWWDRACEVSTIALESLSTQVGTFRAAVIRVRKGEPEVLEVLAKYADPEIGWESWRDLPLHPNQSLAGEAYARGAAVEIQHITERDRGRFSNWDWIQRAGVQSCASFPLRVGDRALGTMTVFLALADRFAPELLSLMATFANCFALFWDRVGASRQKGEVTAQLQSLMYEHEARRLDERSNVLLHQAKNGWRELQILLRRLEAIDGDGRTREILRRAKELADRELASLLGDDSLLEPQAIDVGQELRSMIRNRQLQLRDNRIKVNFAISEVPLIKMPEHEFKEVINNLVANAIWAIRETGRGSGKIEIGSQVQSRVRGERNQEVVIWVEDNGIGIPRDSLEDIFRRGFTTSRNKGGTGLGLFLTRSIVESYGGQVRVESRLGEGSRFEVRWPLHWISA